MNIFKWLFGKKDADMSSSINPTEQAVLVHLNGTDLPDEIYDKFDLFTLEDKLISVIESTGVGEFDGNEIGPTGATLYMYGRDAERLFEAIEKTLSDYPLCQGARVVIRYGGPGSDERIVTL